MAYKNYGPNVSQTPAALPANQFSGEEKSFETVIIQEGKPVIDWEMNLREEVARDHGTRLGNQRFTPSCFLSGDYFENPSLEGSYEFLSAVVGNENQFKIKRQDILANGWHIQFDYSPNGAGTAVAGENTVVLNAVPATGTRTDLVILEVWRALIQAAPSVANKSAGGLILRNGNVKCPDAYNFADDLIDPVEAAETSARVQIQYRYRVIDGVNIDTYPDGLDDPSVDAFSVSDFGGPGADGASTGLLYSPVNRDPGLWRAGAGDAASAAALGTVDGYMYAIPICAVFRRNSDIAEFDRDLNLNGGVPISAGTSDRPDGLFIDQIVAKDVKDLRKTVARDYNEILQKTTQQVFDNSLTTQHEITASNIAGTTIFAKEDVGVAGNSTGNPDRVRRFFSDRCYTETIVARVEITGAPSATAIFDLNSLDLAWNPGLFNLIGAAPTGTNLVGVKNLRVVDPVSPYDKTGFDLVSPYVDNITYSAFGPDIDTATVTFDVPLAVGLVVYAELMIEYPAGNGLYRNVIDAYQVWGPDPTTIGLLPAPWIDGTLWTLSSDATRYDLDTSLWNVDNPHREALIRIRTIDIIDTFYTDASNKIYIPERLTGAAITVDDGGGPLPNTNYTYNTAYTEVQLATAPGAGTAVLTTYKAYRPAPDLPGTPVDSFQVFFESAAIQSIEPPAGTQTIQLIPRAISNFLYIIANGSGSPDDAFPYDAPGAQIAIPQLPTPSYPESILDTPNVLSIVGFGINTGFMQTESKVPYTPRANEVTLHREPVDDVEDDDGRFFWPRSTAPSITNVYSPIIYGQLLSSKQRHKVAFPVVMELAEDFASIGRKGTIILVMMAKWGEFDDQNNIRLSPIQGDSGASVYRVRGNLLNPQRTDV